MKELWFHGKSIVVGSGAVQHLQTIECKRVFIVIGGNSVYANGSYDKLAKILDNKGCEICLFPNIPKNPPVEIALKGLAAMREFHPDTVIGLGGGSAIDAAKAMTLFYDHPELDIIEAYSNGTIPESRTTQLIAIPTTSGTGTEVTRYAVLTFKNSDIKIGARSVGLIPDIAILDADLTISMPQNVVAETGMDAMSHAVECYMNANLDDFSSVQAAGAIEGLFKHLPESYAEGTLAAREKVHNFQSMAGCAFSNVGLGMDHGIAHAFGGKFNYGHGLLVAVGLPYVVQFNVRANAVKEKIDYLSFRMGKDLVQKLIELNYVLKIPRSFKDMGLGQEDFYGNIDLLVENSLKGSTRFNPVPVSPADMRYVLTCMYEGTDIEIDSANND